jgi:hypothetical protein
MEREITKFEIFLEIPDQSRKAAATFASRAGKQRFIVIEHPAPRR